MINNPTYIMYNKLGQPISRFEDKNRFIEVLEELKRTNVKPYQEYLIVEFPSFRTRKLVHFLQLVMC